MRPLAQPEVRTYASDSTPCCQSLIVVDVRIDVTSALGPLLGSRPLSSRELGLLLGGELGLLGSLLADAGLVAKRAGLFALRLEPPVPLATPKEQERQEDQDGDNDQDHDHGCVHGRIVAPPSGRETRLRARRLQQAFYGGSVEPVDFENLSSRALTGDDSQARLRHAQDPGEELDQRVVRPPALGRRRDPGPPAVAVPSDELAARRARRDRDGYAGQILTPPSIELDHDVLDLHVVLERVHGEILP